MVLLLRRWVLATNRAYISWHRSWLSVKVAQTNAPLGAAAIPCRLDHSRDADYDKSPALDVSRVQAQVATRAATPRRSHSLALAYS